MSPDEDLADFEPDGQAAADEQSDYEARVEAALEDVATEPMAGGMAMDLVTRQLLYVRRKVADTLEEYYEAEGFDLATYGVHPYLPVTVDDAAYECVYLSDFTVEKVDKSRKTYDFPAGRLCHAPVEQAWADVEVGDV